MQVLACTVSHTTASHMPDPKSGPKMGKPTGTSSSAQTWTPAARQDQDAPGAAEDTESAEINRQLLRDPAFAEKAIRAAQRIESVYPTDTVKQRLARLQAELKMKFPLSAPWYYAAIKKVLPDQAMNLEMVSLEEMARNPRWLDSQNFRRFSGICAKALLVKVAVLLKDTNAPDELQKLAVVVRQATGLLSDLEENSTDSSTSTESESAQLGSEQFKED